MEGVRDRPRGHLRPQHPNRREHDRASGDVGDQPRHGRPDLRRRSRSRGVRGCQRTGKRPASARVHGSRARHRDRGDRDRSGLHRIVYERAGRGSAGSRRTPRRSSRRGQGARDGCSGICRGEAPGRGGRVGRSVSSGRLRVAGGGLLHVPGDEPGHPRSRTAMCVDVQPELRRASGTRWSDPPREPGHSGGLPRSPDASRTCGAWRS